MTICACTETSSADTGSSATMNDGFEGEGAGQADALALPAAELVRVAFEVRRVEADEPEQLRDALAALGRGAAAGG